jgi:4'-phosphopantetheinyl transferase
MADARDARLATRKLPPWLARDPVAVTTGRGHERVAECEREGQFRGLPILLEAIVMGGTVDARVGDGGVGRRADPAWTAPPGRPPLPRRELHVWRSRLDHPRAALDALWDVLSADERARADRFRADADRDRFVAARGTLRALLGRYLDLRPGDVVFRYSAHGKPELARPAAGGGLRFNAAHSEGLALYAFALGRDVGVDVERVRPLDDAGSLAGRLFSAAEAAALRVLPAPAREEAFFDCWTRKEAYVKALGGGLSLPLDAFTVAVGRGERTTLPGPRRSWTVVPLAPGDGYTGALAVPGPAPRLRRWNLGEVA